MEGGRPQSELEPQPYEKRCRYQDDPAERREDRLARGFDEVSEPMPEQGRFGEQVDRSSRLRLALLDGVGFTVEPLDREEADRRAAGLCLDEERGIDENRYQQGR